MMMVNLTSNETNQHPVPLDIMHREGHNTWAIPPKTLTLNTVMGKYARQTQIKEQFTKQLASTSQKRLCYNQQRGETIPNEQGLETPDNSLT